jgi:hypothetical protein
MFICPTIQHVALSRAGRTSFGASERHLPFLAPKTGDLAAFEFDLQTRAVRVRVGGPGLFEQIEDHPLTASTYFASFSASIPCWEACSASFF